MKICHININSIRHKFEPVREVLNENVFDVFAVNETKIDQSFPPEQFSVPNFKLYRRDYKSNEGGLILYIRNDFPQFRRQDLEKFNIDNDSGRIELLAIQATTKLEKWIFISFYKQPKVNVCVLVELMDKIMTSLIVQDFTIVFIGDFNVNMLKENILKDCLDLNGLKNSVNDVTCVKGLRLLLT